VTQESDVFGTGGSSGVTWWSLKERTGSCGHLGERISVAWTHNILMRVNFRPLYMPPALSLVGACRRKVGRATFVEIL